MEKFEGNILKIPVESQMLFENFVQILGGIEQVITSDTAKPLVIHYQTNQATYVKNGNGYIALSGKIRSISQGDFILIEKGISHSFMVEESEMNLVHFHWPIEKLESDRNVITEHFEEWDKF